MQKAAIPVGANDRTRVMQNLKIERSNSLNGCSQRRAEIKDNSTHG